MIYRYKNKDINFVIKKIIELIEKYKSNFFIRELAIRLTKDKKKIVDKINAIWNFLKSKVKYVKDIYNVETLQSPLITLYWGAGDCDDLAIIGACFLNAIGIKIALVLVSTDPLKLYNHIYLYCILKDIMKKPKRVIVFDLTADKLNKEPKKIYNKKIIEL